MCESFIKCLFISFLLLVTSFQLHAQQNASVILKNARTQEPVEGAVVSIRSIDSRVDSTQISDAAGQVTVPLAFPLIVTIQHINYKLKADTLRLQEPAIIFLEELNHMLDGVVVTGQYEPQSAKNSVFNITTLDAERIQAQGAISLQDVLKNTLNIRFSRDNATGVSGISMQGISGQNVKVLLDGVPIIGRSGINNEVDLNQINVEDVQRIELIEGPMAVNYGSDALAGVINIISKKDIEGKISLGLTLHEETVGNEYNFFSEGIHAPAVQIGYKLNDNWYSQLSTRINRFGGWQGDSEGRNKAWYPKDQYFADGLMRYEKSDFSIYYKTSYLNELLSNLGVVNDKNPLKDPFAIDEEYHATRWIHQLQTSLVVKEIKINAAVSYTDYQRDTRQFSKNMVTGEERNTVDAEQDTTFYRSFFFRNTVVDLVRTHWLNTQLGLEGSFETSGGTRLKAGNKHLTDLAFFASAELKIGQKLMLRPGVRAAYNSVFPTVPMPSVNLKYALNEKIQLRIGYGRGFRAPSIRELFHEFIDSNHNIQGNEELEPEYAHNVNGEIRKQFAKTPLQVSLGGFFNYINNRITLYTSSGANQATTYTNLQKFKSTGGTIKARYNLRNFQISSGFSYIGLYQLLNESYSEDVKKYLFSPELNTSIQYLWNSPGLTFNLFYKFYGSSKNYQIADGVSAGESSAILAETDSYQLLDFNINKNLGKYLSVSAGAKNILDVTSLASAQNDSAHGSSGAVNIAYGRSYFVKLNFQFNK